MYKVLIAGPGGVHPKVGFDLNEAVAKFLTGPEVECFSSLDPADLERCDGMAIPGGYEDVGPWLWGAENTGCNEVDEQLDRQQIAMLERAVQLGKPILGICRGHQISSVYFGATLDQDISCKVHHWYKGEPVFHKSACLPGSFAGRLWGTDAVTNTAHHQAIATLPDCLRAAMLWCPDPETAPGYLAAAEAGTLREAAADCVIEAVEHVSYPFIGLQWHPEFDEELTCPIDLEKLKNHFKSMMEQAK